MKKSIKILVICTIAFVVLGACSLPAFMSKNEERKTVKIKADNAAFTTKILEEFRTNPSIKASSAAQKVCDELNATSINPYDKNTQAYTFDTNCKGCISVTYDDELNMVVVTAMDKKGSLTTRTVIKPPSFVVYEKDEN